MRLAIPAISFQWGYVRARDTLVMPARNQIYQNFVESDLVNSAYIPVAMKGEIEFTALHGVMEVLRAINNKPALGTGVNLISDLGRNLVGPVLPPCLVEYIIMVQQDLFGRYPRHADTIPSYLCMGGFVVMLLLHLAIYIENTRRGHHFYLLLGWMLFCAMRIVGFGIRAVWSRDLSRTRLGIGGLIFLVLPLVLLMSLNLILAQRIFTWRHPVGGSRRLFWNIMIGMYAFVAVLVSVGVVASCIPFVWYLSEDSFLKYRRVNQFAAVNNILYGMTSIALLGLAFFFKPTAKDDNLYTYQPWWIESFLPFYFVKRGAREEAEESFMKRGHYHRHAIRVIAATDQHYRQVKGLTNKRGSLKHNLSIVIIVAVTVLDFTGGLLRAIVVCSDHNDANAVAASRPVGMYITWGIFDLIINALYIIGRIDLRLYRPDRLPRKVQSIITANQSQVQSESDEGWQSLGEGTDTHEHTPAPEIITKPTTDTLEVGEVPARLVQVENVDELNPAAEMLATNLTIDGEKSDIGHAEVAVIARSAPNEVFSDPAQDLKRLNRELQISDFEFALDEFVKDAKPSSPV